ncbi:MAG: tetratricopeptide repeat protein [Terricaulis sp.]|nr:tetratricopeptide repeat protein [Terricaulis sp.]
MPHDLNRTLAHAKGLLRQRAADEAIAVLAPLAARHPDHAECHLLLGAAYRFAARWPACEAAYRRAIEIAPADARAHNNLADALRAQGDFDAALPLARQALALDPDNIEALRNLIAIEHGRGDFTAAADAARAAQERAPDDHRLDLSLARIEHDAGRLKEAAASYQRFLRAEPNHVGALTDLGMICIQLNKDEDALNAFKTALSIDPKHAPAQFGLAQARANLIPPWHIPMMNEPKRNNAYRDAIRRAVKPGDLVLDLGTGAGLLSMLAAEAGAGQVVGCEMVREVADEAKAIIARNGFADRISIVHAHSRELRIGEHLPRRADVLVSEILADDFVGEGALPSLIDVMERLVAPGARIIPERGKAMSVLVGGEYIAYLLGLNTACGFDVSSFAKLKPWQQAIPGKIAYEAFSDEFALLDYNFNDISTLQPADTIVEAPIVAPGLCYGVLQWLRLDLAPGVSYENHPMDTVSVWNKRLYSFPAPVDVAVGDVLKLRVWQDQHYLYVTNV